jgi:hypothetical protein
VRRELWSRVQAGATPEEAMAAVGLPVQGAGAEASAGAPS